MLLFNIGLVMNGALKVLSYWNLNTELIICIGSPKVLKVLSYWNLNQDKKKLTTGSALLKVLSYWNLNKF